MTKINGEERDVSSSRPLVIHERRGDETSAKLYKLEKLSHRVYEVKAYELGITIVMDIEKLRLSFKVSPWSVLQGQLCGLCGNNNQDQSDDYEIPYNLKVPSTRPVLLSNIISSETCDVDKTSPEEYCRKESKHVTLRRYENDAEMKCTTERKVPQCVEGCRPESTRLVKTCFKCRPEESSTYRSEQGFTRKPYVSRWDERTERDEEENNCEDFYQHIEVPTRCVPAY